MEEMHMAKSRRSQAQDLPSPWSLGAILACHCVHVYQPGSFLNPQPFRAFSFWRRRDLGTSDSITSHW